jgi:holo-[acyl-carrier protein] synthase
MIVGVGIDIIEVDRVAEKLAKGNGFREKIFSAEEISFCEAKPAAAQHYAGRFAAKEAFLKAAGQGLAMGFELKHIKILQEESGRPIIALSGSFEEHAKKSHWRTIHVSLSHIKSAACAVVIIEV